MQGPEMRGDQSDALFAFMQSILFCYQDIAAPTGKDNRLKIRKKGIKLAKRQTKKSEPLQSASVVTMGPLVSDEGLLVVGSRTGS